MHIFYVWKRTNITTVEFFTNAANILVALGVKQWPQHQIWGHFSVLVACHNLCEQKRPSWNFAFWDISIVIFVMQMKTCDSITSFDLSWRQEFDKWPNKLSKCSLQNERWSISPIYKSWYCQASVRIVANMMWIMSQMNLKKARPYECHFQLIFVCYYKHCNMPFSRRVRSPTLVQKKHENMFIGRHVSRNCMYIYLNFIKSNLWYNFEIRSQ